MGNSMIESSRHILNKIMDDDTEHLFDINCKPRNADALSAFAKSRDVSGKGLPRTMSAKIFISRKSTKSRPNSDMKHNNSALQSKLSGSESRANFDMGDLEHAVVTADGTPKNKDLPEWAKELYVNRRDLAPVGTRNLELRNNSMQKQITYRKKRDDYLHNHPDLSGLHMSKIDGKHVYVKNNPLINYFAKNITYVADRQERIKQNDYCYKEAYSMIDSASENKTPIKKTSFKTETDVSHFKPNVSFARVDSELDEKSGLYEGAKPKIQRSFSFKKKIIPQITETVNPKSWHSEVKDLFAKNSSTRHKQFQNKPNMSFYNDIDKFEKDLTLHKQMTNTKHYAAVKYKDLSQYEKDKWAIVK